MKKLRHEKEKGRNELCLEGVQERAEQTQDNVLDMKVQQSTDEVIISGQPVVEWLQSSNLAHSVFPNGTLQGHVRRV